MKTDPKTLMRANILAMAPYSTARDEYDGPIGTFLDANENPYPNGVNRYPDPHQRELKQKLGRIKGIDPGNIFIGNGSDEPIDLVFRIFCDPGKDNVVSITPTYGMYKVAAAINDVQVREVALNADFSLDADKLLAAADDHTKIIFLCSPNNPTGNCFPREDIMAVIERFNGMVVLDEAYIDFASQSGLIDLIDTNPNLIILQTLSKAWGMAGLRFGLAFAAKEVVAVMSNVKYPYNINVLTQRMVSERLDMDITEQVEEIKRERQRLVSALEGMNVVRKIYPSEANFLLISVDDPKGIYDKLINEGIIVRDRSKVLGCEGCLRVSVGTPEENSKLINAIKSL